MTLQDRVVVIPGATGGLGRVVSAYFSAQGALLALIGRDAAKLVQIAADLNVPPERILTHTADLVIASEADKAAETVINRFGRAEVVINLIGGWTGGISVEAGIVQDLTSMLQQHLWSTLYLAQAFIPHLRANRWGRFIIVSSPYALHPKSGGAAYAIAKSAQETLILALAQELKGSGVTANIIQVQTIDVEHERDNKPASRNASWTTPEEIAAAILYLCSDEAQMINGARIPLYGIS